MIGTVCFCRRQDQFIEAEGLIGEAHHFQDQPTVGKPTITNWEAAVSFEGADVHALHRLVYFSRAVVSSADDLRPMMESILSAAVPRNARRGVSGALLACDKWFVQALEGDRLTVGEIYNLICADRRHRDTSVIKTGPIERRSFEGWSMCGRTLSPTDDAIIQTLETRKMFDPADLSAPSALKLLEVVRNLQTKPSPRSGPVTCI